MSAIGPEAHAEFDRLCREATVLDRCPVDDRSHAVRAVYGEQVCPSCGCDLRIATRGEPYTPGEPVPGCLGCEAATMASTTGATMCEPHREAFSALDAAREALRAQPLPAAFQKPTAPRGPNRAQRRRAMFARRNGRA